MLIRAARSGIFWIAHWIAWTAAAAWFAVCLLFGVIKSAAEGFLISILLVMVLARLFG